VLADINPKGAWERAGLDYGGTFNNSAFGANIIVGVVELYRSVYTFVDQMELGDEFLLIENPGTQVQLGPHGFECSALINCRWNEVDLYYSAGVHPNAKVKLYCGDQDGVNGASHVELANAIGRAIAGYCDVISLSWGGGSRGECI